MGSPRSRLVGSGLILPLLLFIFWLLGSEYGWWNAFLLPSPARVASAFAAASGSGELQRHVAASLARIIYGFCLSSSLALTLAVLCAWSPALLR